MLLAQVNLLCYQELWHAVEKNPGIRFLKCYLGGQMETRNVQRSFGVLNRGAHCNLKKNKSALRNTTSRLIKTKIRSDLSSSY